MGTTYVVDGDSLTSVANAIRTKNGTSALLEFPSEFVTAIGNIGGTSRTSTDLQVSGATVTAPAGIYASAASKSVASGSATAPASITGSSATVSTGTNTLTLSKTISVTPTVSAGYVSSGTAGNASVSLTASITTKGEATYHPSTSDQTISASQYLTGAQTINAVTLTNLLAANIKSGVTVKVGDSSDDDCVASVLGTLAGAQTATGTFSGNGARSIDVTCSFEPELVYWYGDPGTTASSGTVSCLIVKGLMAANRYRNNATSNSANIQTPITGMNTGGSSYNFKSTYANGKVTLYSFSSNARNLFTSGRTYSYTFMRWSC